MIAGNGQRIESWQRAEAGKGRRLATDGEFVKGSELVKGGELAKGVTHVAYLYCLEMNPPGGWVLGTESLVTYESE